MLIFREMCCHQRHYDTHPEHYTILSSFMFLRSPYKHVYVEKQFIDIVLYENTVLFL